jgi:opacity protein-like surface antigen
MAGNRGSLDETMKTQRIARIFSILLALGVALPVQADEHASPSTSGFYGGVSLRDRGTEGPGLTFGPTAAMWSRYSAPTVDDTAARALVFGGYRWRTDLAVEASFSSLDRYALRPAEGASPARGVGLAIPGGAGLSDVQAHGWNLDVYTSWTFYKAFALYGRLGYAQGDTAPMFGSAASIAPDARRLRDGVNYGLGVRYDMSSALGLRLEYGRFGRFVGEIGTTLPESDQVTLGVQFRF